MSTGRDLLPDIRASRLPVQLVLRFRLPPRPLIPRSLRRRREPGQLARGRLDTIQALTIMAVSRLRNLCFQVQDQWAHYRGAGADDAEIDFQYAGQRISDTDPGVVIREDFPRVGGADATDDAGDNAEAHEEVEGYFGPEFKAGVPEEEDGEGGADEVCYY